MCLSFKPKEKVSLVGGSRKKLNLEKYMQYSIKSFKPNGNFHEILTKLKKE